MRASERDPGRKPNKTSGHYLQPSMNPMVTLVFSPLERFISECNTTTLHLLSATNILVMKNCEGIQHNKPFQLLLSHDYCVTSITIRSQGRDKSVWMVILERSTI